MRVHKQMLPKRGHYQYGKFIIMKEIRREVHV